MNGKKLRITLVTAVATVAVMVLAACGGTNGNTPVVSSMATVNLHVSDPTTCAAPAGPYSHVYVTITDVLVSTSATAGASDSGWVDLTPTLKGAPVQVDLLGVANNQCFLASLGDNLQLQPGSYQQIRVILQDNSASSKPVENQCGNASNCVVFNGAMSPLQLSSESQTGIKIPSGQIAGGNFTLAAGQTKDLDVDFDACASIVQQGNGQFRLKPVLHAGEVSTTSVSINGKIVDKSTSAAIPNLKAIVALEQKDSTTGIDRPVMETLAAADGTFVFCPVPAGSYDVMIVALNTTANIAYGPTLVTGVQPGNTVGTVALVAQGGSGTSQGLATISGSVTTAANGAGVPRDVTVSALQTASIGGSNLQVTVPAIQVSSTTATFAVTVTTAAGTCTPAASDCATYSLQVPAQGVSVGAFNASGITFSAPSAAPTNYSVLGEASQNGASVCSPSSITITTNSNNQSLTVSGGVMTTAAPMNFTGC
ncbi:MAG TPA: DUF4382 domain-containing protein [Terriglobales bacterium]|nr:DUF4382 domain-containing protein [Terriglobales bacterium]